MRKLTYDELYDLKDTEVGGLWELISLRHGSVGVGKLEYDDFWGWELCNPQNASHLAIYDGDELVAWND